MEATKNICWAKGEKLVDPSTVTRWFKKFCLAYKNIFNHTRSGMSKSMDCEAVLQAIEVNLVRDELHSKYIRQS